MAKSNKTRFFYVLYSDKTRVFDQSERAYYPIYIIIVNILQVEGRYQPNLVSFYKTLIIGRKAYVVEECSNQVVLTWE